MSHIKNNRHLNSYQRTVINNILQIKKDFRNLIKKDSHIKGFSNRLLQLLIEIYNYSNASNIKNIDHFNKYLEPLSIYPYIYSGIKTACSNLLENILNNIETEMFINNSNKNIDINSYEDFDFDYNKSEIYQDLQKLVNLKKEQGEEIYINKSEIKCVDGINKGETNIPSDTKRFLRKRKTSENKSSIKNEFNNEKISLNLRSNKRDSRNSSSNNNNKNNNIEININILGKDKIKDKSIKRKEEILSEERKNKKKRKREFLGWGIQKKKRLINVNDKKNTEEFSENKEKDDSKVIPKMLNKKRTKSKSNKEEELEIKANRQKCSEQKENEKKIIRKLRRNEKNKELLTEAELFLLTGHNHKEKKNSRRAENFYKDKFEKESTNKENIYQSNKNDKFKKIREKHSIIKNEKEKEMKLKIKEKHAKEREERRKRRSIINSYGNNTINRDRDYFTKRISKVYKNSFKDLEVSIEIGNQVTKGFKSDWITKSKLSVNQKEKNIDIHKKNNYKTLIKFIKKKNYLDDYDIDENKHVNYNYENEKIEDIEDYENLNERIGIKTKNININNIYTPIDTFLSVKSNGNFHNKVNLNNLPKWISKIKDVNRIKFNEKLPKQNELDEEDITEEDIKLEKKLNQSIKVHQLKKQYNTIKDYIKLKQFSNVKERKTCNLVNEDETEKDNEQTEENINFIDYNNSIKVENKEIYNREENSSDNTIEEQYLHNQKEEKENEEFLSSLENSNTQKDKKILSYDNTSKSANFSRQFLPFLPRENSQNLTENYTNTITNNNNENSEKSSTETLKDDI